ncbi:hypothetical protein EV646_102115 [Kribbella antiqua]|uniref:DUF2306 domain-containing protein n=1 Tax=Kribbella antiqua TaxID=2512217 RepID=A0A4R2IWV3_9ACTN|nr:hypothetical protein [Kribbella antiqua]TCO50044.1 hypothetical protein EV646_102115 [Kribbella antiqua]
MRRSLGGLAIVHGIVGLVTCLSLIVFYIVEGPFGAINDVGNAVLGVLSAGLAWMSWRSGARCPAAFVGIAAVGAAITVVGSYLVLSDATGFFLAGLVSSVGFALIGVWLIAVNHWSAADSPGPRRLRTAGLVAGAVMALGFINAPGIAMGLDGMDTAPAWTFLGGFSWAGTYLLFPIWSLRLARALPRRQG